MLMYQEKSSDKSKRGSTMVELIALMAIMGLWISAMLGVIGSWIDFAKNTEDTVKAINLAREGIEWVTNWRDTNWLRFSSDKNNCWKVNNYDSSCIGSPLMSVDNNDARNIQSWSYILYMNNGVWNLSGTSLSLSSDWSNWNTYKSLYKVGLDSSWFFTQTGTISWPTCNSSLQKDCTTIFTREIQIQVPWPWLVSTGAIGVTSIVRWWGKSHHEVQLNTTLTNWKSKF